MAAMLVISLAVGFPIYRHGAPLLLAAFFGGVCGVLAVWSAVYLVHRIWKGITPAFSVGDLVVVVDGPHTGATGRVTGLGDRRGRSVVVTLRDSSGGVALGSSQVRKL